MMIIMMIEQTESKMSLIKETKITMFKPKTTSI